MNGGGRLFPVQPNKGEWYVQTQTKKAEKEPRDKKGAEIEKNQKQQSLA